jgi:hypothetical protein
MSPAAQELYAMFAALRQRLVAVKSGRLKVDGRS